MTSTSEFQIDPFRIIKAHNYNDWPRPMGSYEYHLKFDSNHTRVCPNFTALELARERTDIVALYVWVDIFLNDEFRYLLSVLLDLNDRSWSIFLQYQSRPSIFQNLEDGSLRDHFRMLCKMRKILIITNGTRSHEVIRLLQCMPTFEQLEYMSIGSWKVKYEDLIWTLYHEDLEEIMDFPFAPQITGIETDWSSMSPSQLKATTKRLQSCKVSLIKVPLPSAPALVASLSTFSQLIRLDIVLGGSHDTGSLVTLAHRLISPNCHVKNLSLDVGFDYDDTPTLFACIPRIPRLATLTLKHFDLCRDVDIFLPVLTKSPKINSVTFTTCRTDLSSTRKLLKCQLHCRPRLIDIEIYDPEEESSDDESEGGEEGNIVFFADIEKFEETAQLYGHIRHFHGSMEKQSFPTSAWPMLLDKFGATVRYPSSVLIQNAGKDAIFHALSRLLSNVSWIRCNKRKREEPPSACTLPMEVGSS